jgi:hypothetical protein
MSSETVEMTKFNLSTLPHFVLRNFIRLEYHESEFLARFAKTAIIFWSVVRLSVRSFVRSSVCHSHNSRTVAATELYDSSLERS